MRRRRGVWVHTRHTPDKLCVCFPLAVHECRLRWFTSAGDCSDCLHSSSPRQCPGYNLTLQGSKLEWMKTADFIHTYILHTSLLRRSAVCNLAQGNVWTEALSAFWTIHPFTDDTKWCEGKVQTCTNISSRWVFIWSKCLSLCQFGKALWEVLPLLKWKVKVVFRQKLGNLKRPQPHEIFQVCKIQTIILWSLCLYVYILD